MKWSPVLISIGTWLADYAKGFTQGEILHKRLETMSTIVITLLLVNGFSPFFKLVKNILLFLRDVFLGLFFPHKRLKNYMQNQNKLDTKKYKLMSRIELLEEKKNKLEQKINKLTGQPKSLGEIKDV